MMIHELNYSREDASLRKNKFKQSWLRHDIKISLKLFFLFPVLHSKVINTFCGSKIALSPWARNPWSPPRGTCWGSSSPGSSARSWTREHHANNTWPKAYPMKVHSKGVGALFVTSLFVFVTYDLSNECSLLFFDAFCFQCLNIIRTWQSWIINCLFNNAIFCFSSLQHKLIFVD